MEILCFEQSIGEQILIVSIVLLIFFIPLIASIIADIKKPCKKPKRSAIATVIYICIILASISFNGILRKEYQTAGIMAFVGLVTTITVSSIIFNKQKKKSRAEKLKEDKEKKKRKELEDIERRIRAEEEIREKIRQEKLQK